ncbi:MAG: hypothetical protein E6R04_08045 [Spirochaetes bacterium]|nr:MAG: hypothetical protein E6R04_08045 [Spirochaetota bacterium]
MSDERQHPLEANEPPAFTGPVLSLPVFARLTYEWAEHPQRDAQGVMQNALDVLIERFDRYTREAYIAGLRDGFMQGCLASDDTKAKARDAAE